jgi:hypothetical protein
MMANLSQINSVGLTKNLLRAIKAQSHELPPLEAFPKSHIVTFEYYLGVIHFLDEQYTQVWNRFCLRNHKGTSLMQNSSSRLRSTFLLLGECATATPIRTESGFSSHRHVVAVAYILF